MESLTIVGVPRVATIVISALVFLPVLAFEFNLASDDLFFVWLSPSIKNTTSGGLFAILTCVERPFHEFQPVPSFSYWVDYAFYGLMPYGFYITHLLLHLANVVLLYVVIQTLTGNSYMAVIVCLVFGIYPLQSDTVAMINQRENLLATMFTLLSILSYMCWKEVRRNTAWTAAFVFFVLSVLSDSTLIVVPVLLLLVDYYKGEALTPTLLVDKIHFGAVMCLVIAVTIYSQTSAGMFNPYLFGSFLTQCRLMVMIYADYLLSFFLPIGMSVAYTYDIAALYSWKMVLAVVANFVALSLLLVGFKLRWRSVVFGIGWFYVCLAPVCQILPLQIVRADRYMYHSLIGLAVLSAAGIAAATGAQRRSWVLVPVFVGITAVLAPLTIQNTAHYSDSFAYVQKLVQTQGWNSSAEALLGRVYHFKGSYAKAARLHTSAVTKEKELRRSAPRIELAQTYQKMGRLDDATATLDQIPPGSLGFEKGPCS